MTRDYVVSSLHSLTEGINLGDSC